MVTYERERERRRESNALSEAVANSGFVVSVGANTCSAGYSIEIDKIYKASDYAIEPSGRLTYV